MTFFGITIFLLITIKNILKMKSENIAITIDSPSIYE